MNNIKAIIYARVSSREQEETGYSLDAQEKLLKDYALAKNFEVKKIFRVSESASGKQIRKTFNEMLQCANKNKAQIILCEKIDRLTRNLKDAATATDWINENNEREIHFVKESFVVSKNTRAHENLVWDMKVAIARFYTNNLSEEVKKGQKAKISAGWLPTKPPLGYKTVGDKGHKIHVPDETKAPLVKKMFELYATGNYSVKKLVYVMYDLGLRTNGGNKFGKSRLSETLADPFFCGKIRWNGDIYDGNQEPLVSKDLYDAVQIMLKSKTTPKYSKHTFLFKGLIKCKECGGIITWETHRGITYGHCNHYRSCTQTAWPKEKEIDDQIIDILDRLQIKQSRIYEWVRKALKETHKDKIEFHNTSIRELEQRLRQTQNRLDRLYDDKLDGTIDEKFYKLKFRQFSEEKEAVLNSMKKHSHADNRYFELSLNFFELAQKAKEIYVSLKDIEKKANCAPFYF